jgi:signal transduction histidine kinase
VGVATGVVVIGLAAGAAYTQELKAELLRETAVEDVARYSEALREFRSLYTSEVVERAMSKGLTITHEYEQIPGALPLPATLSMLLGTRLTESSGGYVRLYSNYPFPHREGPETFLDAVEIEALEQLIKNPEVPVHRFEEGPNGWEIRYFTADRMRPSCVDCHNNHPETPKQDWKVGDVRGVLEVSRPLGERSVEVSGRLDTMVWLLLAGALAGLMSLAIMANRFRLHALANSLWATALSRANRELEAEAQERRAAEEERDGIAQQALYSQKLESLGLMAGGIAHDFNNMLLIILGNADLALKDLEEDHPARKRLSRVLKGGERAALLTRQLQAYAGQSPHGREPVDLNQCVEEMVPLLSASTERRGELVLELEEGLPLLLAVPGQVEQVLLNLVTNASEALGEEGGTITVRTGVMAPTEEDLLGVVSDVLAKADSYVFLEVEDTGCGMDEATRQRIFDPFFSTKGPGRGLGMAAVHGILHSNGGGFLLSSGEELGTVIRAVLPGAGLASAVEKPRSPVLVGPQQRLHILVVDDEEGARDTTCALLQSQGFTVDAAHSGEEGLRRLREEHGAHDLVVLDMTMPQMDGLEMYREIEFAWPALKVLFVSGFSARGRIDSLPSGRVAFLNKPFGTEELLEAVLGFPEE